MNKETIYKILCEAREKAREKNLEVLFTVHHEDSHLVRIGNSSVSLNTAESLTRLDIGVFNGKRIGMHTQMGEISSLNYVLEALSIAEQKCKMSMENNYVLKLPVLEKNIIDIDEYDEAMVTNAPKEKVNFYKQIIEKVGTNYNYSGAWSSGSVELLITSTANDNHVWHKGTDMQFNLVLKHPTKKWEIKTSQSSWKFSDFSTEKSINELNELLNIYNNKEGIKLQPGEYTVAFGSEAIAEVLLMAIESGLKGREFEEKNGWTSKNKIGDKIFNEKITITDDPTNFQTFCFKFDSSGIERKPFTFIKDGKLTNIAYDSLVAARYNKKQTGHSLSSLSISMNTGKDNPNPIEATKGLGKVIIIPMLHYLGLPNPGKGIFTGSSRFNGILVENGKILGPVFSSRITDSFTNVFGNIAKISSKSESSNISDTYERRSPIAMSLPSYVISEKIKVTDSSDSF